jgi:hypothetical protein
MDVGRKPVDSKKTPLMVKSKVGGPILFLKFPIGTEFLNEVGMTMPVLRAILALFLAALNARREFEEQLQPGEFLLDASEGTEFIYRAGPHLMWRGRKLRAASTVPTQELTQHWYNTATKVRVCLCACVSVCLCVCLCASTSCLCLAYVY